mmetsp:Transcript_8889/g.7871  ORF Transcript_8889/g.7871 Transcript_8889/m.7871 type:complete len:372 (-) Transcript_8889:149-1264(-)|eukprot:CAMPEP_0205804202 /NCGR_PEP_ID=MMETSP0205-20121125/7032_1 /ASSEMBLY_ACC=CAM_ASM_000278 /TAXON_ID=36767 /ORGANISM="Euplotes focardii, Strain TN1" /LENGTH=371 /DNA_ID=CAMNT_0053073397 /DNA_START=818 /DNA_END=1933 /DNA_ORIENTATION=+
MNMFKVDRQNNKEYKNFSQRRLSEEEDELKPTLYEFLQNERDQLTISPETEREAKIAVIYDDPNFVDQYELVKREFIIKTRQVSQNDDLRVITPLFLHIFIDMTQITQLEEAKAQSNYQKQMLANVSHEFRTPINAMIMSLYLLKDCVSLEGKKFHQICLSSSEILRSLVEDILDHAKIESGVFEVEEGIFRFRELFQDVKDIFYLQAQSKKLEIIFEMDDELQYKSVKTDKQRIKQVLLNLISNAMKFTDTGSIKIHLQTNRAGKIRSKSMFNPLVQNGPVKEECDVDDEGIELSEDLNSPSTFKHTLYPKKRKDLEGEVYMDSPRELDREFQLKLTVTDTGIGIPPEDQSSLFKLFGKTSSNHNRNKTG